MGGRNRGFHRTYAHNYDLNPLLLDFPDTTCRCLHYQRHKVRLQSKAGLITQLSLPEHVSETGLGDLLSLGKPKTIPSLSGRVCHRGFRGDAEEGRRSEEEEVLADSSVATRSPAKHRSIKQT